MFVSLFSLILLESYGEIKKKLKHKREGEKSDENESKAPVSVEFVIYVGFLSTLQTSQFYRVMSRLFTNNDNIISNKVRQRVPSKSTITTHTHSTMFQWNKQK